MQLQRLGHLRSAVPSPLLLGRRRFASQALPHGAAVQELLDRTHWMLHDDPAVQVTSVQPEGFALIRDDLLHPLLGGNKWRKLDGLWAQLAQASDVVTCGGMQSAHALAVAAACAERGKRCHLLLRGEAPAVPTGNYLYARMLAHRVVHVPRSEYAHREAMFERFLQQLHLERQQAGGQLAAPLGRPLPPAQAKVASSSRAGGAAAVAPGGALAAGSGGIAVIPEGAAGPGALLGLIRLVAWLARDPRSPLAGKDSGSGSSGGSSSGGSSRRCHLVVDSGTGATATGLALGAVLLGLPWRVTGVTLAGDHAYYEQQQRTLTAAFCAEHGSLLLAQQAAAAAGAEGLAQPAPLTHLEEDLQQGVAGRLRWAPRATPRKFGRVLPGDVAACRAVAQRHGVLLDPIWSLAAWEAACQLAQQAQQAGGSEEVAMLHTGGALGLCGLAQRYPDQF